MAGCSMGTKALPLHVSRCGPEVVCVNFSLHCCILNQYFIGCNKCYCSVLIIVFAAVKRAERSRLTASRAGDCFGEECSRVALFM